MTVPRATYRLQLHKGFTFDDAAAVVPYLAALGISHLYASPITQARPGSLHGYDIVDHSRINTELGGEEGFFRLSDTLKAHGLGLILDIVPNHMGVGGSDNACWLSVLEWGELSPFADMFDIDWGRLGAGGKLVVPFLGNRYGLALEAGELQLRFHHEEGAFSVWHWEHRFPILPLHYAGILDRGVAALGEIEAGSELLSVAEVFRAMASDDIPDRRRSFPEEATKLKARIAQAAQHPAIREAIDRAVTIINGAPGTPESFGALHRLLEEQVYRLAHWRVAASEINYRRFFDINSLGGVRVENPDVFTRTHELIFRLVRDGRVDGLRIDHVDGLADPAEYVAALQREVGPDFYILIEKILEPGEALRNWPFAGTTGYDALNAIGGIFVDTGNARRFDAIWRDATGVEAGYGAQLRAAKEEIVETAFASELEVLVSDLKRIADLDWTTRDFTMLALRRALVEIIARLPVYRTYITDDGRVDGNDRSLIEQSFRLAKRWSALPDRSVHEFIRAALLGRFDTTAPGTPVPEDIARFRRRFQQLTGPAMAKSLEDTLFYRFVRFISLNEVGGDPDHFGTSLQAFHAFNAARARDWPYAMTATSTHDTKRGEDARARLNVLSEMPDAWAEAVDDWEEIATEHLAEIEGEPAPDANDRFMMLQSILGAWPLEILEDDAGIEKFRDRIREWTEKALRESKRHTSWTNENIDYEAAALALVDAALAPGSRFMTAFRPLVQKIAVPGALNGIVQTILKCTLPGVPDIYQGTERWDFSLVDPDNRRPVDFGERAEAAGRCRSIGELLSDWRSGDVKQHVLGKLLKDRAANAELYAKGDYQPLTTQGAPDNVLGFTRSHLDRKLLVVAPRLASAALEDRGLFLRKDAFGDAAIRIEGGLWTNVITGNPVELAGSMAVSDLFAELPFVIMRR